MLCENACSKFTFEIHVGWKFMLEIHVGWKCMIEIHDRNLCRVKMHVSSKKQKPRRKKCCFLVLVPKSTEKSRNMQKEASNMIFHATRISNMNCEHAFAPNMNSQHWKNIDFNMHLLDMELMLKVSHKPKSLPIPICQLVGRPEGTPQNSRSRMLQGDPWHVQFKNVPDANDWYFL